MRIYSGVILALVLLLAACQRDQPADLSKPAPAPVNVEIAVDKEGKIYWNGQEIDENELAARLGTTPEKLRAGGPKDLPSCIHHYASVEEEQGAPIEKSAQHLVTVICWPWSDGSAANDTSRNKEEGLKLARKLLGELRAKRTK
jgi:hypothetical protein